MNDKTHLDVLKLHSIFVCMRGSGPLVKYYLNSYKPCTIIIL